MELRFLSILFPIIWSFLGVLFSFIILVCRDRTKKVNKYLFNLFLANIVLVLGLEFFILRHYSTWTQVALISTSVLSFLILSSLLILIIPMLDEKKIDQGSIIYIGLFVAMLSFILIITMANGYEPTLEGKFSFIEGFVGALTFLLGLYMSVYLKDRFWPHITIVPLTKEAVNLRRTRPKRNKKGAIISIAFIFALMILYKIIFPATGILTVVCEVDGDETTIKEMYVTRALPLAMVGPSFGAGDKNLNLQIFHDGKLVDTVIKEWIGNGTQSFGYEFGIKKGSTEFMTIAKLYRNETLLSEYSREFTYTH